VNKEDYISYWQANAAKDWKRVNTQLKNKDYVFALFCAHLTLEKLIKAHWVKDNISNYPTKIHNLNKLVAQTKLTLTEEDLSFCADMNNFRLKDVIPISLVD
jgi:HEPN domain-containing protein